MSFKRLATRAISAVAPRAAPQLRNTTAKNFASNAGNQGTMNRGQGQSNPSHMTKDGRPDRRFAENRGLPPQQGQSQAQTMSNSQNNQRSGGQGQSNPSHMTKDGRPDRRFAENRGMPPQGQQNNSQMTSNSSSSNRSSGSRSN